MALEKCSECGGQVSTKARMCPHCGAPIMRHQTRAIVISVVLMAIGLMAAIVALLMATEHH